MGGWFWNGEGGWYPFTDYAFWQKCDLDSSTVKSKTDRNVLRIKNELLLMYFLVTF